KKILLTRAALRRTRIEPDFQSPDISALVRSGYTQQVGALPIPCCVSYRTKITQLLPVLEIRRSIEPHFVLVWERNGHHPAMLVLIPGDAGVAKIRTMQIKNWIVSILHPRTPSVETVGEILILQVPLRIFTVTGIDRHHAFLFRHAKLARILVIDNNAPSENHDPVFFWNGDRQFLPMQ